MSTVSRKENKMPVFRVFMEYNRPMYGEFYIGMEQGKELDDFVIENFLHWNIECLELEEDTTQTIPTIYMMQRMIPNWIFGGLTKLENK